MMRHRYAAVIVAIATSAATSLAILDPVAAAGASTWNPAVASGSHGQGRSGTLAAPAGTTATCSSSSQQTVVVSWTAATHANGYTIYVSTTSATSGFASTANGVSGTSWTSATLAAGSYWFKVAAQTGTSWVGTQSSSTVKRTIATNSCA